VLLKCAIEIYFDLDLEGRLPGKTRLLLEEVLLRPAGGAHLVVCVGPKASV